MITYKEYFQILDELRISNNMSVSELCEGVMSERTYFRNLYSNEKIKFSNFIKLLQKLEIGIAHFVIYAIHLRGEDTGVIKFVSRVQTKSFFDIKPIYEKVLKFNTDDKLFALVVKAFIKKYEYLIEKINKDEYKNELELMINQFDNDSPINIFEITIYSMYIELENKLEVNQIKEIINTLINMDLSLGYFYHLCSLDNLIFSLLDKNIIEDELMRSLIEKFQMAVRFISHKSFYLKNYLYTAYLNYLDKNESEMRKNLLLFATNHAIVNGKDVYELGKKKMKSLFNLDFDEFLKKESNKAFNLAKFKIIN